MSSNEDESDGTTSNDDEEDNDRQSLKIMLLQKQMQSALVATSYVVSKYYSTYLYKNPPRTSQLMGYAWLMETLRTPGESHKVLRMNATLFYQLHALLESKYGLKSTNHMSSMESLAIFLTICGQNRSNSSIQNTFKHSGKTISRKFDEVLHCLVRMGKDYIRPKDRNFTTVHKRISGDQRINPHFKDCIGAIDGTHILATPPPKDYVRYIGRSGNPTQNVMTVVDFDMCFTYSSIGQPGSMHDTSVLYHALEADRRTFPHPPLGKYYLVDAGYPNRPGYLAPYKGQRYHVPNFRRAGGPTGEQEVFNFFHSSVRNVVERTFGVWKVKWRILKKMPSYSMDKQKMIVAATMCLHNFIRENHALDRHFRKCDEDPDYVPTIPQRYRKYAPSQSASDTSTSHANDRNMDKFRDDLARALFQSRG